MPDLSPSRSKNGLPRLLRAWALAALVTFGVMLAHQSDAPVLFGRYSLLVGGILAALLVGASAAWVGGSWLKRQPGTQTSIDQRFVRWREKLWFTPVVLVMASLLLAAMWIFFLGNHLPTYGFLRMFIGMSIVVGALALLAGGDDVPASVWLRYIPWLGVGLLAAFALLTTPFYPNLAKTDEAFVFSMARNWLETGRSSPAIYPQSYPDQYYGGLWIQLMAGWLRVAGVTLTSARLYNLALAALSLLFLWGAAARLYDKITAWFAILIGAYAFIALNHIRFDIHAAVWLSVGLFCFSRSQPGRWWLYVLTGLSIGLTLDSSPVTYCFILGLLLFYAWDYLRAIRTERRWWWPPFWCTALGGAGALAAYFVLHSDSSFAGGKTSAGMLSEYTSIITSNLAAGQYFTQIQQYVSVFLTAQPLLFGLLLLGIGVGLRERSRADRFLLTLHFTWLAVIVFAYFYFPAYYLVLGLPIFILLAARGLARGGELLLGLAGRLDSALAGTITLLLLVWLVAAVTHDVRGLGSQSIEDVVETGRQIGQIIPTDAVVVGAEPYYFGMLDHRQFVAGDIERTLTNTTGYAPDAVWPRIAPDAVIFSEKWPTEPERSPTLLSYMADEGFVMLACYQTQSFGRVELWTKAIPDRVTPSDTCAPVCNPRTGC